ncbi:hypothetical protein KC323_g9335 [Hortaea werneckii]|nr:hypothetical protein KC323_g9335 [Hortaea werneckii]
MSIHRRTDINTPSMVGILGGKTDRSVELTSNEQLCSRPQAENEKEVVAMLKEEDQVHETTAEMGTRDAQA